jgi:hypothetical protein
MTFLEYVAERLLGPPARRCGKGDSYWNCPFHGDTNPSFHTMPHKSGFKDRWCCFGCGTRGDEADLMKEFYQGEGWPRRKARLEQWRQEYEREGGQTSRPAPALAPAVPSSSLRGAGSVRADAANDDPAAAASAWDRLTRDERDTILAAHDIIWCKGDGVSFDALADQCLGFAEFIARSNAHELANCDDPECVADVCRAWRGLPPRTRAEIEADRQRFAEEKREREDRVAASVERARPKGAPAKRLLPNPKGFRAPPTTDKRV